MEIKAFRAYRFNGEAVGDAGSCITPPYDVIDANQQDELYRKSQYNIVRIIRGKEQGGDDSNNNVYTRAREYFSQWLTKGVLKQDEKETIYAYVQDFEVGGAKYERTGFIALAKVEEFGKSVHPHEQTLSKPKADRLNLMRATAAQFGLIFMVYDDSRQVAEKVIGKAMKKEPVIDFADDDKVRHRLFAIEEKEDIEAITKMMGEKSCVIADGHHRYETALNFSKEDGRESAGYVMTAFVNAQNPGLVILATHRVVNNLEKFSFADFLGKLKNDFEITEFAFGSEKEKSGAKAKMLKKMKEELEKDKNAFGIYAGGKSFYAAVLKDKRAMDAVAKDKSVAWRGLDVCILQKLILDKQLGIDDAKVAQGGFVEYVKDTAKAIDNIIADVDAGRKQVAFFTNPPKMSQVNAVAGQGEKMPQKSTFFYPKVFTGMTINKL